MNETTPNQPAAFQPAPHITHQLETPLGLVTFRKESAGDATFLLDLFRSHTLPALAAAPIDAAMQEALVRMQFTSQTNTYRSQYPGARFTIIERNGTPAGRLVVHETGDSACIVDLALQPDSRGAGFGSAVLGAVLQELAERVTVVHCSVMWNNQASLRMLRRLGFVQATGDPPFLRMQWRRP
jgi:RimJ/RimL family protein N-acetyltransferase